AADGNLAPAGPAASRRAYGSPGPEKRRTGDPAHRTGSYRTPVDDSDGDAFDAAGRQPWGPFDHDVSGPNHPRLPRSAETPLAGPRPAGTLRGSAPQRTTRRNGGGVAAALVRMSQAVAARHSKPALEEESGLAVGFR